VSGLRPTVLVRRAAREHRVLVTLIAVLVVVNVALYAAAIYPFSRQVASVSERTLDAEMELAAAQLARTRAAGALSGTSQASMDLELFYRDVLPADLTAARRVIWPRLQQIARQAGLQAQSSNAGLATDREQALTQLLIKMELTGSYRAVRDFIHRLERASEFLVIQRVALQESNEESAPLTLQLDLATYYKGARE
jgi:Tfp pilus assembly protein PilO